MEIIPPVEILPSPEIVEVVYKAKTSSSTKIEKPVMHAEDATEIFTGFLHCRDRTKKKMHVFPRLSIITASVSKSLCNLTDCLNLMLLVPTCTIIVRAVGWRSMRVGASSTMSRIFKPGKQ